MADVGMNLAPVFYYGTQFPFIDRMKMSNGWTAYGLPVSVDAHGNPLAIPTGSNLVQAIIPLDPVSASTPDVYELTWSGTGTFQVSGAKVISSQPGKLVFQYTNTTTTMANLVAYSISATDPVHDIHVVRQDQVDAFKHGDIFNPEFLSQVSNWQTLRFMDWENINNTTATSWDQRTHVEDMTWADNGNSTGVPIEIMIKLANEARADMWFNIPTYADDTYVRNALQMIKTNLAPGLKVHVEYSNEMWNTGFQQTKYAQDTATKLWGTDANHDGVIDPKDPAEYVYGGMDVYYGYRSAQIAAIANSVFSGADDDRLAMVFATQNGNNTREKYLLDGIAKANVGTISSLFDEWSVTSYFGLEFGGAIPADKAKILGWADSGEAGMAAAFQELAHGGAGLYYNYSIDDVKKYLIYEKSVADRYGLDLVGYEGGFHGSALYFGADQAKAMDFLARLMADPRMEDLYKYWFDTFEAVGGKMLAAYYDVAQPSAYGTFGALASLYDPKSPRYNALLSEAAPKGLVDGPQSTAALGSVVAAGRAPAAQDFNGDGRSDVLWRNANGTIVDWLSNGTGFSDNASSARTLTPDMRVAGAADFSGDGRADILLRNATGMLTARASNGTGFADSPVFSRQVSLDWQIVGTADFNGDSKADILWRNNDGTVTDWLSLGSGFADNGAAARQVSLDWHIAGTGDLNGDGRADILWRNDNGTVTAWTSNGPGFADNSGFSRAMDVDWHIAGTGDFNGDGRTDILWRSNTGSVTEWLSTGSAFIDNPMAMRAIGVDWQISGIGDYNGDGQDDVLWRNANGSVTTWLSNGAGFTDNAAATRQVGLDWSILKPATAGESILFGAADFNGDGKDDLLWRNANGTVTDWLSNGAGFSDNGTLARVMTADWHIAGTGDFNGDGRSDVLWRNVDGTVTDWLSNGTGFTDNSALLRGVTADWRIEATGDFNGDGKDDILWRNADGTVKDWISTGLDFVDNGSAGLKVGADWHIQATGDFNGDGKDDILWRNANGTVTDWVSNGTSFTGNSAFYRQVGPEWTIAATGDFNGDGKDDILWRNADGSITDWLSTGAGFQDNASFFRGVPLDWQIMGVGDFNGDGRADIEWRHANGTVTDWLSNGSGFSDNAAATRSVPLDWAIQHDGLTLLI